MKFSNVPTAYVLLNSDLGSDESIISEVKKILEAESEIKYGGKRTTICSRKTRESKNRFSSKGDNG